MCEEGSLLCVRVCVCVCVCVHVCECEGGGLLERVMHGLAEVHEAILDEGITRLFLVIPVIIGLTNLIIMSSYEHKIQLLKLPNRKIIFSVRLSDYCTLDGNCRAFRD